LGENPSANKIETKFYKSFVWEGVLIFGFPAAFALLIMGLLRQVKDRFSPFLVSLKGM
jgi:hypothetical protein